MPVTRSTSVSTVLISNAASPCQAIQGIEAKVAASESGTLAISYNLIADIDQLLVPVAVTPRRADGLWRHSCFEAFVSMKGSTAYYELNFSPSGEWAVYRFHAYRDGRPLGDVALAPNISLERTADRLTLAASFQRERLPMIRSGVTLRIGLSAVIEGKDGTLSYWALRHPAGRPDFHHPDSFALELALPVESV